MGLQQKPQYRRAGICDFITLECDRGDHDACPGQASPVRGLPKAPCMCIHHTPGVVLPQGFPGRT